MAWPVVRLSSSRAIDQHPLHAAVALRKWTRNGVSVWEVPLLKDASVAFDQPAVTHTGISNWVKNRSVDNKQEQRELQDHESNAVHPQAMQREWTNHSRRTQAVTSHRWFDPYVQASAQVRTQ
ncbi:hypothetical protein MRX96_058205 [Rhipicephalus microplus]